MGALRDLAVRQQVALLFVLLFGLLGAAGLWSFFRSLRPADTTEHLKRVQRLRNLRALSMGSLLFWVCWASGAFVSTLLFGVVSFLALREYVTLTHTRRGDHRSLLLAFFVVLPFQYVLVGTRHYDLFMVFIPVYMFLAIPVVSAFGNDPERFLERTAKIQWGIMVCVYGLSHAPALLLLSLPRYNDRGPFLVLYLVAVVVTAQLVQRKATGWLQRQPSAPAISHSFSARAWLIGAFAAAWVGALLYWATPLQPIPALLLGFVAGGSGTLGELVMKALKRDAGVRTWGAGASVTGAVGLLDRVAPLCFAAPVFFHATRWHFSA
jgi:phosphatidate cytidylyltransferase